MQEKFAVPSLSSFSSSCVFTESSFLRSSQRGAHIPWTSPEREYSPARTSLPSSASSSAATIESIACKLSPQGFQQVLRLVDVHLLSGRHCH